MMHIGKRIRELLLEKQMSITLFAEQLGCTRENAHRILAKEHLDSDQLLPICQILDYDLFKDLSEDYCSRRRNILL